MIHYNASFNGEDFTVMDISDIKESNSGSYYRELTFDRHPNPELRDGKHYTPKVREFHNKKDDFANIFIGQVLHDVHIYAKSIGTKTTGRFYSLDEYDGHIIRER